MDIKIVSQYFYPDSFLINDIVKELSEKKHNIHVITGLPDYSTGYVPKEYKYHKNRKQQLLGAKIRRISMISRHKGIPFRILNYMSFMLNSTVYSMFCKKHNTDVIFVYGTSPIFQALAAVVLKKRTKKKLVLYCCDLWPESLKAWGIKESNPAFKIVKSFSSWIYKKCDVVAVTSKPFKDYLMEVCNVQDDKIVYLPQYAEDVYAGISGCYTDNQCIDFMFAGNIGSVQNIDCIVNAVQYIITDKNYLIHIVGDGSELENIKQLAEKLKVSDKFVFHGRFPRSEMEQFYKLADCFLLTLNGDSFIGKTIPGKLQSYFSAGKPIIAAIDGAASEIIKEADAGFAVSAGDAKALAKALQNAIESFEPLKSKGENARLYYKNNFTKDKFIADLLQILNS